MNMNALVTGYIKLVWIAKLQYIRAEISISIMYPQLVTGHVNKWSDS